MNIEELFKNTLVLSLEHRFDRRKFMQDTMKEQAINFYFFNAINGVEIENSTNLLPGEYGIKKSHIEIIKEAQIKQYSSIFIFEDDVEFCENFKAEINNNIKLIPDDCDLLFLGGAHRGSICHVMGKIYKTSCTYTTHAMWINSSIYSEIIKIMNQNPNQQLDNCYVILQNMYNCYTFYPNLAWQKDDYSDIQNKFVKYDWLKPQ
jgi:hypothetical protein